MSIALAVRPEVLPLGALHLRRTDLSTRTVLVAATGEIDAGNARELVDFVDALVGATGAVVVDLGGLAFFGTEGLWALNRVKAACAKYRVRSAIVAGAEVARLLRICDPHGALGVYTSVDDALAAA